MRWSGCAIFLASALERSRLLQTRPPVEIAAISVCKFLIYTPVEPNCILIAECLEQAYEDVALALKQAGYKVITVQQGKTALELVCSSSRQNTASTPDLLILDRDLSDINGVDLCQILRQKRCYLPILMVSGNGDEMDRVVGLEAGSDDYLIKPFGMRELVARCKALLRRSFPLRYREHEQDQPQETEQEHILSFEEILLYPNSCRVVVRGREVTLSRREFHLLEFLIAHPHQIWSRNQLLKCIWGKDSVHPKTIDVHISWLRQKLEADPKHPKYLQTVASVGYRLG